MRETPTSYPVTIRVLHWAMALLIILQLTAGLWMTRTLSLERALVVQLHQVFGLLLLILVAVRVAIRLRAAAPSLPRNMSGLQRTAAHASHLAFYVLMIGLPVTGLIFVAAGGNPPIRNALLAHLAGDLRIFFAARELHAASATALAVLILLHMTAALHHGLLRKDGVFSQMTFRSSRGAGASPGSEGGTPDMAEP